MQLAIPTEAVLETAVATTFDVLAWEIELAAARCIALDSAMSRVMECLPNERQADFLEQMHAIDLLSQQLTGLSAFTRRMSDAVHPMATAQVNHALGDITLGALADRMCEALGGKERGINDRDGAGDLDLF